MSFEPAGRLSWSLPRRVPLVVARRFGCYLLAELGGLVGVSYAAVAQTIFKAEGSPP
jgi:hypothetical protein